MQALGHLNSLSRAVSDYSLSNQTVAMEKDGQQSLTIGYLATVRMGLVMAQIKIHTPQFNVRFTWAPLALGVYAGIARPLAEAYLNNHSHPVKTQEKIIAAVCRLVATTGQAGRRVLQHADKILNTACLINGIALISLGFPMTGSIALFGLFTLALKRYLYLPASVERYMSPIVLLSNFATTINMPMNMVLKIPLIALNTFGLASQILNSHVVRSCLPERYTNPFYNKHVIHKTDENLAAVLADAENSDKFDVNFSHIYSDEVGRLMPTESDQSLSQIKTSELFDQLTNKIEKLKVHLSDEQKEGLNNLKICAITGRVKDITPCNIELFQKIIKLLALSILKDDDNFSIKIKELADVGNSCVEGWTRDITALLAPQTKDAAWAVHNVLAKMRGEMLKEAFLTLNEVIPILNMVGGSNDVHVTNIFQTALWHRFRTFEGELNHQLSHLSVLQIWILRNMIIHDDPKRLSFLEAFYVGGLGMVLFHKGWEHILSGITDSIMDPEPMVNVIYDAIKPKYQPASNGRVDCVDAKRVIIWQAIQAWMAKISENRNIDFYNLWTGQYDSRWIERDVAGGYFLSKAGVRLLLWDLGILTHQPHLPPLFIRGGRVILRANYR